MPAELRVEALCDYASGQDGRDCGASQQRGVRENSEDWAYTGGLGDGQGCGGPL